MNAPHHPPQPGQSDTALDRLSQKTLASLQAAQQQAMQLAQGGDPALVQAAQHLADFSALVASTAPGTPAAPRSLPLFSPWHIFEWLGQINRVSLDLLDDAALQQLAAHHIIHYEKDVSIRQHDDALARIAALPEPLRTALSQHFSRLEMMGCISRIDFTRLENYVLALAQKYHPEINRRYPLRTLNGAPLKVIGIDAGTLPTRYLTSAALAHLHRLFDEATSEPERQTLCTASLVCRMLTPSDLRSSDPLSLAGQNGVFAARDFAAHELIGAYTGYLIRRDNMWCVQSRSFSFSCKDKNPPEAASEFTEIVGNGIISRVNSIFTKNLAGQRVQAESGYNSEIYGVRLKLENGTSLMLPCYFTAQPVKQGEEFRANYGYSDEAAQLAIP
ncbi:hypothetical protein [Paraburkholderia hayleyella]|uniref:hypothetical protein n=1 Tax=Paraburkholderia hayleyella TaxID=2152889 RepID=UPI0012927F36|nr:hypothetical protein [Paraburkholderia hayleyella]